MSAPQPPPPLVPSGRGEFSDSAGAARLYGALADNELEARAAAAKLTNQKRRLNCVTVLTALLLPWGLFVAVFGVVSFYCHYAAPVTTMLATFCVWMASVCFTTSAWQACKAGAEDRAYHLYVGISLTVAVSLGWVMGDISFWQYMQPTYHIDHLATYTNVDPSSQMLWSGEHVPARGRRYQDAGKVYFSHDTVLDRSKATSFKDGNLYCVAPIVNPNCKSNCGYDFWAVGINCCSDVAADFRCGDFNSTRAKSGLRQVVETWRPFFRLAVLQAEGFHGVTSRHPLFFHWVEDPVAELHSWRLSGYRDYILAMITGFILNVAAVVLVLKSAA